jgi:hypothetical protein
VDTASRWPNELELIGADLVAQYGEEYELIYAVFRTPPKYELHDVGFYVENERVADAWNAEMQRRGKEWGSCSSTSRAFSTARFSSWDSLLALPRPQSQRSSVEI